MNITENLLVCANEEGAGNWASSGQGPPIWVIRWLY